MAPGCHVVFSFSFFSLCKACGLLVGFGILLLLKVKHGLVLHMTNKMYIDIAVEVFHFLFHSFYYKVVQQSEVHYLEI